MRTNERYLEALRYMDKTMRADNKAGDQWSYCNVTSKKVRGFENKRKKKKFLTNCVDGVQDALRIAGIPESALGWYGTDSKIAYTGKDAKKEAEKYFRIIKTGGKTPQQLFDSMSMADGDILLGYKGISHTNCFMGGTTPKSFDSGHAFCSGEDFKKWIGNLCNRNTKVFYILRLKDRAHYRVQCGAYINLASYNEMVRNIESAGYSTAMVREDNLYKISAGYFDGKTNAERLAAELTKKGISAYVKEVD